MGLGLNIEVTEAPVYACPYCPATFGSQEELSAHIAAEHVAGVPEWLSRYWPVLAIGGVALSLLGLFIFKKKGGE